MSARRVAIVTGARAEYGLLRPVIRACESRNDLDVRVIATGAHLLPPAFTIEEVERECANVVRVEMQHEREGGRLDDTRALGRGIERLAGMYGDIGPDVVLVLGDRIEALAGAASASVGGIVCTHMHGGDRAEGVADESMRHAITKLAHLHLPATSQSAERITRMGEAPWRVRTVGSPAIDGLDEIRSMDQSRIEEITSGRIKEIDALFLMHPVGRDEADEHRDACAALSALSGMKILCLSPNTDAGRVGIARAIAEACERDAGFVSADHLERSVFIGLLKYLAKRHGVLVGNSSCALIECAAIGLGAVDIGARQGGRERARNVVHAPDADAKSIANAVRHARARSGSPISHPFGNGTTGQRVATVLAEIDIGDPKWLRKRNVY